MELERKALESMFNDLQIEKKELKENYRKDLAEIENRQFQILDRFRRLDDWERDQVEKYQDMQNEQQQEAASTILDTLEQMTPPPAFEAKQAAAVEKFEYKQAAPEVKAEPEPEPAPEIAPENKTYTGVKVGADNVKRYQLYYTCNNSRCRNKGKRYITPQTTEVFCHECATKLKVRPATSQGFPQQDSFNNFFIAGNRITEEEVRAYSNPVALVEDVLTKYEKERESFSNIRITKKEKKAPAPAAKKAAAPAAKKEQPTYRKSRVNEVIAAIEMLIESTGAMTAKEIEKALKETYGWEWKNFYNMFNRGRELYQNAILKDGNKFITLRVRSEAHKNENGPNNAKQEATPV